MKIKKYIQMPDEFNGGLPSLFLAGGITGCPDWQKEMAKRLKDLPLILINPRRDNYDFNDPNSELEQIEWEHRHLRKADVILFWFPEESLCPISLYELGTWSMTNKPLFVGTHPGYKRKSDIKIQTKLVRPELKIYKSLDELEKVIRSWSKNYSETLGAMP